MYEYYIFVAHVTVCCGFPVSLLKKCHGKSAMFLGGGRYYYHGKSTARKYHGTSE